MNDLLLTDCTLVDVVSGSNVPDAAIAIAGGRIAAAGPRAAVPSQAAATIELDGAHVLPGLINCHVHFGLVLPGAEGERLRGETEAARALRMAANARATLQAGVTTVRLVGEEPYADIALRASIRRGETVGPRVLCSGPLLVATGGHGWELPGTREANGADGFRHAVREHVKHGVDWVKISVSGGIAGENEAIADAQMTHDEIAAVTDAAHARRRKVAAHAGPAGAIATAVELGVDTIEHGYFLTDEVAELLVRHGAWLVPTINVSRAVAFFEKIGAPEWMIARALAAGELHWAALQSAIRAGVRIAMGTDMMPSEPFDGTSVTVREIEFMVEAGMAPVDALRAATCRAAEMLGLEGTVGSIAPGLAADVIAVGASPLDDVSALRDLRLVVAAGAVMPR
ncbi:MAG: amidohydrolase family protein [Actinobacteria bacterium]|nr:amidohydrolase family protein [Actinomycetota bacterium]